MVRFGSQRGDHLNSFGGDPVDGADALDEDGDRLADSFEDATGFNSNTMDSDGDTVGDNADAFPNDANESTDTDGDNVPDRWDAYPDDPLRSQQEVAEENGNVMIYSIITILIIGLIAGIFLVFIRNFVRNHPNKDIPHQTQK